MKTFLFLTVVLALIVLVEQVSGASTAVPDSNQPDKQTESEQKLEKWQQLLEALVESFDLTKDTDVSFPESTAGKKLQSALDKLREN